MFEAVSLDFSRDLSIVICERSVDGSEVGSIFISGEVQSHVEDEFVELDVLLNPEEGHDLLQIRLY